jgi:transposase
MLRDGIRDDQWDRIKDLLPGRIGHVGATARNNRLFIDAVLYRIRTGIPWRDLPERFGDFKNIHRRFSRWAEKGLWTNLLSLLTEDADEEYVMIDSTLVRAHQHSSGAVGRNPSDQAIGRSRGGLTTKIHARVDALGNPTEFFLTAGQVHDLAGAEVLLTDIETGAVIADKAYDAEERVVTRRAAQQNLWSKPESRLSFRRGVAVKPLGSMTGSCIKPATSLRTSFANSSTFGELPHATISCLGTSWPLFSSPPS